MTRLFAKTTPPILVNRLFFLAPSTKPEPQTSTPFPSPNPSTLPLQVSALKCTYSPNFITELYAETVTPILLIGLIFGIMKAHIRLRPGQRPSLWSWYMQTFLTMCVDVEV